MGRLIGIDLGTTNSVVAIVDGPQPKVLDNREARSQTRSVVGLRRRKGKTDAEGELIIGDIAYDNWPVAPRDTVISVKRLMGRASTDREIQMVREWASYDVVEPSDGTRDSVRVVIGGKEYSPIEISAMILKKLKEDAEFKLGEAVTHAVITVPAYFGQTQKDATIKAGQKAGLKVIKILDEPTAAAIAFGIDQQSTEPRTVLVYDLGGGTFDISLLVCAGSQFAPLNKEGDMWLGGDNLDQVIVEHVLAWVKTEFGLDGRKTLRFLAELRKAAQKAKEQLGSARTASIIVQSQLKNSNGDDVDVDLEISREEFERMILPMVARYRECDCEQANYPDDKKCAKCGKSIENKPIKDGRTVQLVKKAIKEAGYTLEDIHHVLMAGNSSNVPLVQKAMEDLFGPERIVRKIHPKHCVAMGAAIVAARVGPQLICQAPDKADPKSECGEVNTTEARSCRRCGATLVPESDAPVTMLDSGPVSFKNLQIGGITAFHYGTRTSGDKFNVFVKKGDPYPTEEPMAQTHSTNVPGQRMVSIPVYGGEDLQKASGNTKQGEAFAVLPPGLPKGSAVRIKMWLDENEVFDLSAHLETGTDLKPWITHGEGDARAIAAIERAIQRLSAGNEAPSAQADLELQRTFDLLKNGQFSDAEKAADAMADPEKAIIPGSLRDSAEGSIRFTEFLLHQYGWAFDANTSFTINRLVGELQTALRQDDDAAISNALAVLEVALANLPPTVETLLMARAAINQRVAAVDPARAAELMRELDQAEDATRRNPKAGGRQLQAALDSIEQAFVEVSRGVPCSRCETDVPRGVRWCPKCNEDVLFGLQNKPHKSGPVR